MEQLYSKYAEHSLSFPSSSHSQLVQPSISHSLSCFIFLVPSHPVKVFV